MDESERRPPSEPLADSLLRAEQPPLQGDLQILRLVRQAEAASVRPAEDRWIDSPPRDDRGRDRDRRSPTPPAAAAALAAVWQTVFFLVAMAVMLLAARFVMPPIVEEARYAWHRGELRAKYETSGEGLQHVSLDALSHAYQMVTHRVGPSVVHIDVKRGDDGDHTRLTKLLRGSSVDDLIGDPSERLVIADQGSGVVIDEDGHVMTNYHVVADGNRITVGLSDGRRVPAEVVGVDQLTDLALLKISADRLTAITWGDSDACEVGSPVWAVGSPFGLDRTVTFGILSGKHRVVKASNRYQDFMQSDAAVNPGNSGGPLVDARGHLVGLNTAIVGDTFRGVSFAIPSNVVRQVAERLKTSGRVDRGWLGLSLAEVDDDRVLGDDLRVRGALVAGLVGQSSPAAWAGAQVGDLIVRLDGQPVRDVGHLMRMAAILEAGATVQLDVHRGEHPLTLQVVVGSRPGQPSR